MNRNVWQLSLAQALMMSVTSLMVTAAALIGARLADNPALATLPLALQFIAIMSTTIPASMLMARIGRKAGFLIATAVGLCGAGFGIAGVWQHSFELFCLGSIGTGVYTAFGNYFRFAAVEVVIPERKNVALGTVLAGGVLAAFVGPNLAHLSRDLLEVGYLGTMLSVAVLYTLGGINIAFMNLPRPGAWKASGAARPLREIAAQPKFVVAMLSAAIGYSSMSLLMTATPLAMTQHQHDFAEVAFVIQWHVLGMFVPSFFTGHLINRFGAPRIIASGIGLMLCCQLLNLHGSSAAHFWGALLLLGIGWNFMFIGGSSLLTETYRGAEAARAQACNDFVVFSSSAIAALGAGALLHWLGWRLVNFAVSPSLALATLLLLWLWSTRRAAAPAG